MQVPALSITSNGSTSGADYGIVGISSQRTGNDYVQWEDLWLSPMPCFLTAFSGRNEGTGLTTLRSVPNSVVQGNRVRYQRHVLGPGAAR